MLGAQAAYVDHLIDVVEREKVDLVVVSGDVYDRALPQVDAVALADEAFSRVAASRAKLVVTSGNHDSAQRLGFGSRLIDAAGVFIRTDAAKVATPVLLDDQHGKVAVYGIPYLEPDAVREPWGLTARSHEAALGHGDGAHPSRPGDEGRPDPVGGAGARVRGRLRAERVRARHQRRRGVDGVEPGLRRCRLRRAGAPARPPGGHRPHPLQRLPARLQLQRGRPGQGLVARRPRPRRRRDGGVRRGAGPPPAGAAARRARGAAGRREPEPSTRRPTSRSPSPTTPAPRRRWSGCASGSRTRSC